MIKNAAIYQLYKVLIRMVNGRKSLHTVIFSLATYRFSVILAGNKTRQGYARKRTLKPAGCFFLGAAA